MMFKTKSYWRLFKLKRISEIEGKKVCLKDSPHLTGVLHRVRGIDLNKPIKEAIRDSRYFVLFDNTVALTPVEVKSSKVILL